MEEIPSGEHAFEDLKKENPTKKPKVELKASPTHLKYLFLEGNEAKLVVISNDLSSDEEAQLIKVLRKHKEAIG